MATNENLPPNVIKQLAKELKSLDDSPPEGIRVVVNDDDFSIIYADIEGPAGTPYENGTFRMKLLLSCDFPQSPPKGYFLTKIFHPNVATNGEICVNTLKKDWNPTLGLRHVLIVVRCLMIEPFPESALNEQAGKMLLEDYDEYARHARLYTGIHALKKPKSIKHSPNSMASLSQHLKDNFFYLLELVRGTVSNKKNCEAKGTECEEETQAVSVTVKERGILKLNRGLAPPGVQKGPPPEHN